MRWFKPKPRITDVPVAAFTSLIDAYCKVAGNCRDSVDVATKEYLLRALDRYGIPHPDAFPVAEEPAEVDIEPIEGEVVDDEPAMLCRPGERPRPLLLERQRRP